MLEEMQRLSESEPLRQLLDHYASRGVADRMVWQDRLMALESVPAPELTKLHGELLASEWVEMNVGFTSGKCPGGVAACYRITVAGLRAWKRTQGGFYLEDEEEEAAPTPRRPRRSPPGGKRAKRDATSSQDAPAPSKPADGTPERSPDEATEINSTVEEAAVLNR